MSRQGWRKSYHARRVHSESDIVVSRAIKDMVPNLLVVVDAVSCDASVRNPTVREGTFDYQALAYALASDAIIDQETI
jgi:hypothetical protein